MRLALIVLFTITFTACATAPFAGDRVFADPQAHAGETVRFCGRIGADGLMRAEDGSGQALIIADRGPVNLAFTGGICVEGRLSDDARSVALLRTLNEGD